ncbi:MAG: hypothetical protein ISS55_05125 [Dehalococcoidales bacterium]|nr:hypothetical protein [Dehalococcoidales bacterium]
MIYIDMAPRSDSCGMSSEDVQQYTGLIMLEARAAEPQYKLPVEDGPLSEQERREQYWPFFEEPIIRKR